MRTLVGIGVTAVVMLSAPALGNELKTYNGPGGPLVDSPAAGTNGVARFTIFVPDHGIIKSFKSISLVGFSHTWAGDLIIRLTHKDNNMTVTLLDLPGQVAPAGGGDSADFDGGTYTWTDAGFVYDADVFGATVTNHSLGPIPPSHLSDFVGKDKYGTWSLTIIDTFPADTGMLGSWNIVINNVPGPATLALLGMLGFRRRRRR